MPTNLDPGDIQHLSEEAQSYTAALIFARAKDDPEFALDLHRDLNSALKKRGVQLDPEGEAYQNLALRIYHNNVMMNLAFDELSKVYTPDPGGPLPDPWPGLPSTHVPIPELDPDSLGKAYNVVQPGDDPGVGLPSLPGGLGSDPNPETIRAHVLNNIRTRILSR